MESEQVLEVKTENKDEIKTEKSDEIICDHHAKFELEDVHEGTIICTKCGVVIVEQVICGIAEWRTFADDNQSDSWERSRVGGPANRFLSGGANLSTTIRPADRSSSNIRHSRHDGDSFNSSILRAVKRKSVDNGIFHGLKQLDEMADRIHLTHSVLEYAHYLYYKMYKKGKFKGIAIATDAKVGACLYIACYHAQCPRTVNEICAISENGHQSIRSAIKRITKMLNLPVGRIECRDVLPRYCAWLSLPRHIQREAITVADTLSKFDDHRQFDVEVLSAAAIYFVTQQTTLLSDKRSKTDIANSLGITTDEVSFCYEYFHQK